MSTTHRRGATGHDTRSDSEAPSDGDRMRLSEFVQISLPLLVPWTLHLGSVFVLLLAVPRLVDPSSYGEVATTLSISLVLSAASVAIQARDSSFRPATWRATARWAVVAGVSTLAATPILALVFDLPNGPLTLLAPALALSLIAARIPALRGEGARATSPALWTAAAGRVAIGIPLTAAFGLPGILAAMVAAEAVALAVAWIASRPRAERPLRASRRPSSRVPLRPAILATASVVLLGQLDLLLARHHLPARDAGLYAGAAVLTRMLVFVPVIGAVLVLRSAAAARDEDPFRSLHRSVGITAAAVAILSIGLSMFRDPLCGGVLGRAFEDASSLIPVLAVTAGLLALVWQLFFFHVVVASKAYLLLIAVAALEVGATALWTPSAGVIAAVALAGAATAAAFQYVGARAVARWSPPLGQLRVHEELSTSSPTDDEIELSMILPCYNPGPALTEFLERLTAELQAVGSYELIVVSDGSTDESVEMARRFASPSVRVLHYTERAGKGHALRVGLTMARGSFVGFIDADGDIDPQAVGPFLSLMRLYSPDVVLGSKRHPMSQVSYPALRRVMSWVYHKLTRLLFRVNVRDTQTGLKVIRRDVLAQVLPRMFEKRYAFDLELLVVARMLGFTKVFEAPVRIEHRFTSNVDADAVFRILLDTAAIFYRRYILDTYRHAGDRLLLVRDREEAG